MRRRRKKVSDTPFVSAAKNRCQTPFFGPACRADAAAAKKGVRHPLRFGRRRIGVRHPFDRPFRSWHSVCSRHGMHACRIRIVAAAVAALVSGCGGETLEAPTQAPPAEVSVIVAEP